MTVPAQKPNCERGEGTRRGQLAFSPGKWGASPPGRGHLSPSSTYHGFNLLSSQKPSATQLLVPGSPWPRFRGAGAAARENKAESLHGPSQNPLKWFPLRVTAKHGWQGPNKQAGRPHRCALCKGSVHPSSPAQQAARPCAHRPGAGGRPADRQATSSSSSPVPQCQQHPGASGLLARRTPALREEALCGHRLWPLHALSTDEDATQQGNRAVSPLRLTTQLLGTRVNREPPVNPKHCPQP